MVIASSLIMAKQRCPASSTFTNRLSGGIFVSSIDEVEGCIGQLWVLNTRKVVTKFKFKVRVTRWVDLRIIHHLCYSLNYCS